MTQVPEVSSEAVVPETEQTVGDAEAKLTARPEVAVADRGTLVSANWVPVMAGKVIVWLVLTPVPLSAMLWVALVWLSALSVSTTLPGLLPATVGMKLIDTSQLAPAAKGVPEVQRLVSTTFSGKLAGLLGLLPTSVAKSSGWLPMLATCTVCGQSLLVKPSVVAAKVSDGGVARLISFTALL